MNAQFDDIEFDDLVYFDHLKSVEFIHDRTFGNLPIIRLNSPSAMTLKFDDLEAGDQLYTYRIIHCDKNWNPSPLDDFEYIDGFNGEEIDNISYSAGQLILKFNSKYALATYFGNGRIENLIANGLHGTDPGLHSGIIEIASDCICLPHGKLTFS